MSSPVFRLAHRRDAAKIDVCLIFDKGYTPLGSLGSDLLDGLSDFSSIDALLADWDRNFDQLVKCAEACHERGLIRADKIADLASPVLRPGRMLYAAANYRDHVAGMRKTFTSSLPDAKPADSGLKPYLFAKVCHPTGPADPIFLPPNLPRTDWEAELAVVIGRTGKNMTPDKVADHIAGYMTTNDVSCRDLTWREDRPAIRSDWLAGKSFDGFAPMGPWLTPKAFVPDHSNLAIRLWVNGEIKQDGNSRDMMIPIEDQIAWAGRMMTLMPGDIFSTGTPAGTGQERLEFLKAGDVIEVEVQHCGRQRTPVLEGTDEYAP